MSRIAESCSVLLRGVSWSETFAVRIRGKQRSLLNAHSSSHFVPRQQKTRSISQRVEVDWLVAGMAFARCRGRRAGALIHPGETGDEHEIHGGCGGVGIRLPELDYARE